MAAFFAARGFPVIAADVEAQEVDEIGRGVPPVHEPGLADLLKEARGRLQATQDTEAAVRGTDATFIVVGTPSEPSGGFSLRYALPLPPRQSYGHKVKFWDGSRGGWSSDRGRSGAARYWRIPATRK